MWLVIREPAEALCLHEGWGPSLGSSCALWCRSDYSLTSSLQDMFDPHGWSEDSYYEALGNLCSFLFIYSSTHPSVCPSSQ